MYKLLTEQERSRLLIEHRTGREKRIADRLKVILWSDESWSAEAIARALFIDDATVRRHREESPVRIERRGPVVLIRSECPRVPLPRDLE